MRAVLMKMKLLLLLVLFLILPGCSSVKPWVKPYERQNLADPIMAANRHPVSNAYLLHVHEAREGSRGGAGSGSAGCGCN
ncbi:MAG: DUF4266 domain-containing protein [Gammaproteobacteria bacterium]|nr:DUF4266 domain-containing protein [Gammaproteobacteria bacterium]